MTESHFNKMDISEFDGKVCVNGFYLDGHIAYGKECESCGHTVLYDTDYDAYFCPNCNAWHSENCGEADCMFCAGRPERPLPQPGVDDGTYPCRNGGGWGRIFCVVEVDD